MKCLGKRIIIVSVHADDETLGCGGTIMKHKEAGDSVYWMLLTKPTLNHPCHYSLQTINDREDLVIKINKEYGFNDLFNLGLPTQLLHTVDIRTIIQQVGRIFQQIQPNIVYIPFCNDVHSDHRVAFDAIYSCTKNFRYPSIKEVLMMETLSETEFAPSVMSMSFVPNIYVDITKFQERKMNIMSMYKTELMDCPYPRSLSSIEALARLRGSRAGVMYAESFMQLYGLR